MPILDHLFPSTSITLVLTLLLLLQHLPLTSSQSASQPNSPTSSLPATSTPTAFPSYNFTYPTLEESYDSGIQVSYKDTVDVSWVANGLQHDPELQIQCWVRNDSSSFIYYETNPSYTHNLITSPSPSLPSYPLPLAPYQQYSPCHLRLLDSTEDSDSVASVAIFISQETNASTHGVTWSVDNEAPQVAVDAGVATATSGSAGINHRGAREVTWMWVGLIGVAMTALS